MTSGTLALWLVGILWALFAYWVWGMKKFMDRVRKHLWNLEHAMSNQRHDMITLDTLDRELRAMKQNADAQTKLTGCVLAERIDALSARLDAVELKTGIREKPKTMGGK